ncbi:MAG: hypothetical protein IJR94_04020 [Synergistaceae bacterium]|nr:hypothetical protein [Synergistaceae bacterium]
MENYQNTAAIITAVEVETQAVKNLYGNWKKILVPGDPQEYFSTLIDKGGKEYKIITAQQKVMGMTACALLCAKVISRFRPRYLIMCGVAAGISKNVEQIYGDVIVPNVVWDYTTGKFVGPNDAEIRFGDVGFLPRPVSLELDPELLKIIRSVQNKSDNEFKIHIGPMACGSSIVANKKLIARQVLPLFPTTVALDMESYSVVYAAQNSSDPAPKALVIKSICDYGNEEKSDMYQKFAAFTSSNFAKYLLENYLPLD